MRGQTSLLPLLAQVLDAVRVPVLAAGGIATARDLAAALAAGRRARGSARASSLRGVGRAPRVRAALLARDARGHLLTEAFSVHWPNAPHRVLRCCVAAATAAATRSPARSIGAAATMPVPRFAVIAPTGRPRAIDAMALYAGESVGARAPRGARRRDRRELVTGAEDLLRA